MKVPSKADPYLDAQKRLDSGIGTPLSYPLPPPLIYDMEKARSLPPLRAIQREIANLRLIEDLENQVKSLQRQMEKLLESSK